MINRAIFDCIARFFSDQNVSQAALQNASAVEDAFKDLCMDQDYRDSVEKTPKTTFATHTRIDMWGRSLAHVLGMQYDGNTRRIL